MNQKVLKITLVSIFCLDLIAIPIFVLFQRITINQQIKDQSIQTTSGKPSIPVTDLAPEVPMVDKTTLTIKHSDSTFAKIIMPKTMVNQYIQNLSSGDIVVAQQ